MCTKLDQDQNAHSGDSAAKLEKKIIIKHDNPLPIGQKCTTSATSGLLEEKGSFGFSYRGEKETMCLSELRPICDF